MISSLKEELASLRLSILAPKEREDVSAPKTDVVERSDNSIQEYLDCVDSTISTISEYHQSVRGTTRDNVSFCDLLSQGRRDVEDWILETEMQGKAYRNLISVTNFQKLRHSKNVYSK